MNTEATQDHQEANTTGARLRHAREQLGLSQQAVAERLCLKVSTVRDIEDDKAPADLASARVHPLLRSPRTYSRRRAAADDGQAGAHPRGESRANAEFLFRQAPQKARRLADELHLAGAVCGYRSERRLVVARP